MARKKSATKKAREATAKLNETEKTNIVEKPVEKKVAKPVKQIESESDVSDSESSEEEDEFGELITDKVETGINDVLNAIRNNETDKLLNPEVKFFEDPEKATGNTAAKKADKPIYLKDYHRMNIMSGISHISDDEEETVQETVDGKPSFVEMQRDERNKLLSEINDAFSDDEAKDSKESEDEDEEDDGFLKKKAPTKRSTKIEPTRLANPANADEFLDDFLNKQAWLPRQGDQVIELDIPGDDGDEDDEEFDKAAEKFENAYNFRYEDPNAAEIISYARTQATLRRSDTTSRRRKRDGEKEEKVTEMKHKEEAIQKKRTKKVNKLTDVLEQLKKEFGAEIDEKMVKKITSTLLNNDYSENNWDSVVTDLFNDEFYNSKEKPEWDDDLMHEDVYGENEEEIGEDEDLGEEDISQEAEEEDVGPSKKKAKKLEKLNQKKDKKKLSEMVNKAVEQNKLAIIDEFEKEQSERGRSQETKDIKFRYREVSPESFGLTTREIFAADDADLNDFISLKKFAPYRASELQHKDKRKVMKSRRMRDWRKKVFKNENGPVLKEGENEDEISIPVKDERSDNSNHHDHHNRDKKHTKYEKRNRPRKY